MDELRNRIDDRNRIENTNRNNNNLANQGGMAGVDFTETGGGQISGDRGTNVSQGGQIAKKYGQNANQMGQIAKKDGANDITDSAIFAGAASEEEGQNLIEDEQTVVEE